MDNINQISCITFDLWNTLIIDKPEFGESRAKLRIESINQTLFNIGEIFSENTLQEAYSQCIEDCNNNRIRGKDISFNMQIELFVKKIDPSLLSRLTDKHFNEILSGYLNPFYIYPPPVHPKASKVLGKLKSDGYKLGLISNTAMTPGTTFRKYLDKHQILEYFDVLTFSDEVGIAKPSHKIFDITLNQLSANPESTIHIGDDFDNDVIGGLKAGLKVIWINLSQVKKTIITQTHIVNDLEQVLNKIYDY